MAWLWDKMLWLTRNELILIRNMLIHVRLHHVASENHEKPGEKWLIRSTETIKIDLNFDKTGRDLIVFRFTKFRYIWKSRPRRPYISNFIKIGQCAPLVPCVHLLSLFQRKWLLRGGWFSCAQKCLRAAVNGVSRAKN